MENTENTETTESRRRGGGTDGRPAPPRQAGTQLLDHTSTGEREGQKRRQDRSNRADEETLRRQQDGLVVMSDAIKPMVSM